MLMETSDIIISSVEPFSYILKLIKQNLLLVELVNIVVEFSNAERSAQNTKFE